MKNSTLLILSLLVIQTISSQTFKEVISFHENGNEKSVFYKNQDLEIIKKEYYDINKRLISSYNIDPKTQKYNGEFFNTTNKGSYDQGILTCVNCSINFDNTQIRGNFINGKPTGVLKVYNVTEQQVNRYDPMTSYMLSLEFGERINYSSYVGNGMFNSEYKMSLKYNNNGELDGEIEINPYTKLFFEKGLMKGFVIMNEDNINYSKDSVFRENKIWKVNNSLIKNTGWLSKLYWNEFNNPWEFSYNYYYHKNTPDNKDYRNEEDARRMVFFGSPNSTALDLKEYSKHYVQQYFNIGIETTESKKIIENGIYSKKNNNIPWWDNDSKNRDKRLDFIKKNCDNSLTAQSDILNVLYGFRLHLDDETEIKSQQNFYYCNLLIIYLPTQKEYESEYLKLSDVIRFINSYVLGSPDSPISNIWIRKGESYISIKQIFENINKINLEKSKKIEEELSKKLREQDLLTNFCESNNLNLPLNDENKNYLNNNINIIQNKISKINELFPNDSYLLEKGDLIQENNSYMIIYYLKFLEKPKNDVNNSLNKKTLQLLHKNFDKVRVIYYINEDEVFIVDPIKPIGFVKLL